MTDKIVEPSAETLAKEAHLKEIITGYGTLGIAYSGGVDSTYLADVAHEVLGRNAHMIIADSPSIPRSELAEAKAMAAERDWKLTVVKTREFENQRFLNNDGKRCYFCKSELFGCMMAYAQAQGITVLAYGENADDTEDETRVGLVAAKERNVATPLKAADLTKDEIRALSARRGLPTATKASFACLSSRVPTGKRISTEKMDQIEEAEELLKKLGFHQYRARHHDDLCRIEITQDEFPKLMAPETREKIIEGLKALGYRHVTLDLAGYRTGSTA